MQDQGSERTNHAGRIYVIAPLQEMIKMQNQN